MPRLRIAAAGREPGGVEHPSQHRVVDGLVGEVANSPGGAQRVSELHCSMIQHGDGLVAHW
jgi:hypothetical protein